MVKNSSDSPTVPTNLFFVSINKDIERKNNPCCLPPATKISVVDDSDSIDHNCELNAHGNCSNIYTRIDQRRTTCVSQNASAGRISRDRDIRDGTDKEG